jgi:putative glycosyl hydrolase-like family 6 (GHL6) protein
MQHSTLRLLLLPLAVLAVMALPGAAQEAGSQDGGQWWMDEPIRLIQTNLRQTDSDLDAARLAGQLVEFQANTVLFGLGGIVAHYPTEVEFHYPSPHMPEGRDLFGEMLREAKKRNIRVIGRFDLSKTQQPVFDAHPEWFFRRADGRPVTYNGLYSACINGGYYQEHIFKILSEALERYEVDGLFFNMFGNPSRDYSGDSLGLCHCDSCERGFRAAYGRGVPDEPDAQYREFMFNSSRGVARRIGALIHQKRPRAAFLTYIDEYVDGIMSESNTGVDRPLPMWPYSASDRVRRARDSQPSKMAFNLSIGFVDIPYRMVTVPGPEIRARLYQNMANGSGPMFVALGTLDQEDRRGLEAAQGVFTWHAANEDLYIGQSNAARVLLWGRGDQRSYRGFFRLLSERHIPFAVSTNLDWIDKQPDAYDLVISSDGASADFARYVASGGRLLVAGAPPSGFSLPAPVRHWDKTRSAYFRIHDRTLLPSLADTNLLFLDGGYTEFPAENKPLLTLIPPSRFGPPELVFTDKEETTRPGLILRDHGEGELAYLPWDIGALYYRHSSPGHGDLIADLVDHLLPGRRQLETTAHPLVEITVMQQREPRRTLVHFVNLSGHSQTAYFDSVPMRDIKVDLAGEFRTARSRQLGQSLELTTGQAGTRFVLPTLKEYDVVVLE